MTGREDLRLSGSPSVRIESGHVVGPLTDPESGIAAFRGIPYAAPPMGELRWKPPRPVDSWDGERPCIEYGPACPQPGRFFSDILVRETPARESEDCLYLNVWTVIGDDDARPVMVWLHGGGFISGWGHQRDFEGTALARKGVVVVTVNYRLGPFGFLAHPRLSEESSRGVSGNYGLLDQIEAWLREEFDAIGASFEDRGARTDEYVAAMRTLWSAERPSFTGEFVRFDGAYCRPQPANGTVPIHVGGHSRAAARRAGRIGDGFFPARGVAAELVAMARTAAGESGRDPDEIEITISCPEDVDELSDLKELGIDRILVPVNRTPGMVAPPRTPEEVLAWRGRIEAFANG